MPMIPIVTIVALSLFLIDGLLQTAAPQSKNAQTVAHHVQTPQNFRVAFIGDQGVSRDAKAVLRLIRDEDADMVLHQGDLGYGNESRRQSAYDWDDQIESILGDDFPYFASVGNHDVDQWSTYQQLLERRLNRIPEASCIGDLGVKSACDYMGLFFILSGVGTMGGGHISFLKEHLEENDSIWSICSWHKNQRRMQIGEKSNEVGWEAYEACREEAAIIATGHEHSYQRTKTLIDFADQKVAPGHSDPERLFVSHGSTFAFVSGLAGKDIRDQERCFPISFPYGCNGEWASIYTSDQGADHGALFITFHVDEDPYKARGYFKNIRGHIVDEFEITADRPAEMVDQPPSAHADENVGEKVSLEEVEAGSSEMDQHKENGIDEEDSANDASNIELILDESLTPSAIPNPGTNANNSAEIKDDKPNSQSKVEQNSLNLLKFFLRNLPIITWISPSFLIELIDTKTS